MSMFQATLAASLVALTPAMCQMVLQTADEASADESSESSDAESSDGAGSATEGCEPDVSLQCVNDAVYWFDSCGNMGALEQTCAAQQTCAEPSPDQAECVDESPTCGNGMVEPNEQCEDGQLGGASCESQGFDGGSLGCATCAYDTSSCYDCECSNGVCCSDGCTYDDATMLCELDASEYGCLEGTSPGADVSVRTHDRSCSGDSASCTGSYGPWSEWSVADDCSDDEYCVPGSPTCNSCNWDYTVTQYECLTFSAAGAGNEIFRTCATSDAQGYMTVKARKGDGTTFSNRPYQVRVSDVGDDPCGPNTYYFVIADSDPVGIGTDELTFSFPAQWLAGQTEKNYCVTASTQVGDFGYDADSAQQQSWWYSKKAAVVRTCN